ncbi:MAG: Cold shock protein of CSP family, partial [uncultured Acidimicrobiales bacterium]
GNRNREVLQRREGLRLHLPRAGGRRLRALLQHPEQRLQVPRRGPERRVRRRPRAQGRRGAERPRHL